MIVCYLFSHYLTLAKLPAHKFDTYLQSSVSSCNVYSRKTWEVIEQNGNRVKITNGVIYSEGYLYIRNNETRKRRVK